MSLDDFRREPLLFGPSPIHPLPRLSEALGGQVEIWAKREDCNSGIAFGGNKVRKLEYLAAEALDTGCKGRVEEVPSAVHVRGDELAAGSERRRLGRAVDDRFGGGLLDEGARGCLVH